MTSAGGPGDVARSASRGRRKLRAPRDDRGVLIEPAWSKLPQLVTANQAERDAWRFQIAGEAIGTFAQAARASVFKLALEETCDYRNVTTPASLASGMPLLFAGHQPELFHPGVWAKDFALARLAQETKGVAINLVIDGDTLKTPSLRVPTGSAAEPLVEGVPFDAAAEEIAFEERTILDDALFGSFGRRAADAVRPFVVKPLLESFWPDIVEQARHTGRIGAAVARARHRLEGAWGLQTLELPQSALCDTEHFRRFAANLLADLPRFAEVHNDELSAYRKREGIRSANHPVPQLARDGDYLEAPFWLWTTDRPRRRHVFARMVGREIEVTDRGDITFRFPPADAAGALDDLSRRGVRFRSRALMTTLYARLVLSDLFIHGIGGGKYDELTDAIARRYFGVEPPPFAVVTATRRLPIAGAAAASNAIDEPTARRRLWELTHHPERFIDPASLAGDAAVAARQAIAEKECWTRTLPTRENGKTRCHAIRDANAALQPFVVAQRQHWRDVHAQSKAQERTADLLSSREYSAWLFPEQDLRNFLLEIGVSRL